MTIIKGKRNTIGLKVVISDQNTVDSCGIRVLNEILQISQQSHKFQLEVNLLQ